MITVIIPTYNEEGFIGPTLALLQRHGDPRLIDEVIVADGGSHDRTVAEAEAQGARVVHAPKGRGVQMNHGAAQARSPILYFLHAESGPPQRFAQDIGQAVQRGATAGCYRLCFDHDHWFLRVNCWFTRFDVQAFRYGDQSLFVRREAFDAVQGFDERLTIFEDYDIIKRLRGQGPFRVLPGKVRTSARKYLQNGVYRMQAIFYAMYFLYRCGMPQERLLHTYRAWVRQDKI